MPLLADADLAVSWWDALKLTVGGGGAIGVKYLLDFWLRRGSLRVEDRTKDRQDTRVDYQLLYNIQNERISRLEQQNKDQNKELADMRLRLEDMQRHVGQQERREDRHLTYIEYLQGLLSDKAIPFRPLPAPPGTDVHPALAEGRP